jgi:hypothetical protein
MAYDPGYIRNFLTEEGRSLSDYFIEDGLIMYHSELDGKPVPMALVIEDDALNRACINYLKEHNARHRTGEEENSTDDPM